MTTTARTTAASVTRAVKALAGDNSIKVTTRWCINSKRNGYGWNSIIFVEQSEARVKLVDALREAGYQVTGPDEYESFFSSYLPEPEKQGDAQRGEAFLAKTFPNTRTEF
jgi:hypothetical protein